MTDTVHDCETNIRRRVCKDCKHVFHTTEEEQKDSRKYYNMLKKEMRKAVRSDGAMR